MILPGWCPSAASKARGHFRTNFEMNLFLERKHNSKKRLNRAHYFTARTKSGWRSTPLGTSSYVAWVSLRTDAAQRQFGSLWCCGGGMAAKTKDPKIKNACSFFFPLNPPHLPLTRRSFCSNFVFWAGLHSLREGRIVVLWPGTKKRHDDGAKGGCPPRFGNEGEKQRWPAPWWAAWEQGFPKHNNDFLSYLRTIIAKTVESLKSGGNCYFIISLKNSFLKFIFNCKNVIASFIQILFYILLKLLE